MRKEEYFDSKEYKMILWVKKKVAWIQEGSIDEQKKMIQKDLDRKGAVGLKRLHPKRIILPEKRSCERNMVIRKVDDVE